MSELIKGLLLPRAEAGEKYNNTILPETSYLGGEKAAQTYLQEVQVYGIKGALERLAAGQTGKNNKPAAVVVFER